jgi:hypothetical protein
MLILSLMWPAETKELPNPDIEQRIEAKETLKYFCSNLFDLDELKKTKPSFRLRLRDGHCLVYKICSLEAKKTYHTFSNDCLGGSYQSSP